MAKYKAMEILKDFHSTGPEWTAHLVMFSEEDENQFNRYLCDCHTHGLDKFDSLEIQVVLKVKKEIITHIIATVSAMIECGVHLQDGDLIEQVLSCPVRIRKNEDLYGNEILRIVLPDENMKFPEDEGCDKNFIFQSLTTRTITYGFLN